MSNSSASLFGFKRVFGTFIALSILLSARCPSFAHGGGGGGHFSGGGGHFSGGGAHFSGGGMHFSGGGSHFSSMSSAHFSSFSPHSFSSPHMSSFGGAPMFSGGHSAASASYVNSAPSMHFDSIFGHHHSNAAESINSHAPFNENAGFARQHSSVRVDAMQLPTSVDPMAGTAQHHHFWSFGHHNDVMSTDQSAALGQHHHLSKHDRALGLGMYGDNQGIKAESHPFTIEDVPLHDQQQVLVHNVNHVPYGSHHWLKQQYANGLMTPPIVTHVPVTTIPCTPIFNVPAAPNYYFGPSYGSGYNASYGYGNYPNYGYYGTGYSAYNYGGYGYGYGYGYGTSNLASMLFRSLSLLGLGGYSYASAGGMSGLGGGYNYDPNAYAALNSAIGGGYNYDPNAYANAGLGAGGILDPNGTAGPGGSNYDPNAYANNPNAGVANLPPFAAYGSNSFMNNPASPYIDPNVLPPDPLPIAQPATQPDDIGLSAKAESLPVESPPAFKPVGFPFQNKGLLGVALAHQIGLPSGSYRTPSVLAVVFSHQFWDEQAKRITEQQAAPDVPESVAAHAETMTDP